MIGWKTEDGSQELEVWVNWIIGDCGYWLEDGSQKSGVRRWKLTGVRVVVWLSGCHGWLGEI